MTFIPYSTNEGVQVRSLAHSEALAIAQLYHDTKNLSMEVHQITPGYLGLSSLRMPRHTTGTIDEACAMVACGWWNNDPDDGLVLRVKKGREFITDLELRHIYDLVNEGRKAEDDAFQMWGEWKTGEDLDWEFLYTTADYIDAFPNGYIIIPEGKSDIFR